MIKADVMAKVIDNEVKNYFFIIEESFKAEQEYAKAQQEYFVNIIREKAKEQERLVIAQLEKEYAETVLKVDEERIRANGGTVEYRYAIIGYRGTEKVYEEYGTYDNMEEAEYDAEHYMRYFCPIATSYAIRKVAVKFFDFEKQFDDTLAQVQRDWAKMTDEQKSEAWGLISDMYKDVNGVRPHGMARVWGLV